MFRASWDSVFRSVEMAVEWVRAHQDLGGVQPIGVDEIVWEKGHKYLTLVYQIDARCKRLLWVGPERRVKTLVGFFRWFGKERIGELKYICSDLWKPYLKVIAKKAAGLCMCRIASTSGPIWTRRSTRYGPARPGC